MFGTLVILMLLSFAYLVMQTFIVSLRNVKMFYLIGAVFVITGAMAAANIIEYIEYSRFLTFQD